MTPSRQTRIIAAFASLCTTIVIVGGLMALFDVDGVAGALAWITAPAARG